MNNIEAIGPLFTVLITAITGLGIGSFLNVVVFRVRSEESLTGRSHCPHCQKNLSWYELIPVISYLALRGKCRQCSATISAQYPLVEFVTAVCFGLLAIWFYSDIMRLVIYCIYTAFLIVIFVYDARYYLIPDWFTLPGISLGVIGSLLLGVSWWQIGLGLLIGAGMFLIQFVISRGKWIGGGDIRLGAMMGTMLAFPNVIAALFVAYMLGAVVAIPLLISGRKHRKDMLPFGTFLAVATFITLLTGDSIIHWYWYELLRV